MNKLVLPHKIESEKSVLGAMFLSKEALTKATDLLSYESFYVEANQILFQALKDMASENIPIDATTVTSYLKDQKKLDKIGGVKYLTDIISNVPSASNIEQYIKEVEDAALLRSLIDASAQIKDMALTTNKSVEAVLDESESKILNVVKNRRSKDFKTVNQVLESAERNIVFLSKNKNEVTGLPTGLLDFDNLTTGLKGGQLVVVAGRTGDGKSVVATNIATNVAINSKKTVALFNLEMGAEQLINRMLANVGGINSNKLDTGYLSKNDWASLSEAIKTLSDTKIYFDDTPSLSVGELKSKCRKLASSEDGLDLIIIDYLQLLSTNKDFGTNRQLQVAEISRALKTLALELDVPIIALSQLRRAESRAVAEKRPDISDLRESGAIEQDADIVVLLFREDKFDKTKMLDETTCILEFNVRKHRNGPTKDLKLIFKMDTSTLRNRPKKEYLDEEEN